MDFDFLTTILWVGVIWITGICLWSWWSGQWALEPFTNLPLSMKSTVSNTENSTNPAWVRTTLDALARKDHCCRVLESFADPEFPGATIEIVDSSCEEGLPHTSNANTIRFPQSLWNTASTQRRGNVLRHERVHLLQRRNPAKWRDFYKNVWQYTLHTEPPIGFPDANKVRGNPDTDSAAFACWADRYWFVPLYTDSATPRLGNAEVRVWDAQTKEWCHSPAAWRALFCQEGRCPNQWEHPAEISAEYWTDSEDWKTPASVALRNFILTQM